MGNIIDYARTETRSFETLPFREADALVLAQLSYCLLYTSGILLMREGATAGVYQRSQ